MDLQRQALVGLECLVSVYGKWIAPRHVEQAIIDHLVLRGAEYIAEAERQFGIEPRSIPVPQEGQFTTVRDTFEKWPEDQTPVVLIMSPGVSSAPRRETDRSLTAPVAIALGVIVSSGFPGAGAEAAQIIGTAFKNLMLQLPPAGLDTAGVELQVEAYGDIPAAGERTMGSSRIGFHVWVKNWAALGGGPLDRNAPPPDPYVAPGDWPRVESVFSQINNARRIA